MAKVYTSRALLDPQLLSLTSQNMANRIQQDRDNRRQVVEAIQSGVSQLGSTIDDWRKRQYEEDLGKERYKYMDRVMQDNPDYEKYKNNPFFKAALHEFARTGSASPLMSFISSENSKEEKNKNWDWHRAILLGDARKKYAEAFEKYKKEPTQAGKLKFKTYLKSLEDQFGADAFGTPIEDYEKAQAIDTTSAALKAADQKREEDTSYSVKNWIRENILPLGSIKTKEDQIEIADFIRDSKGLTDSDRKELLDEVLGNKTLEEQHKKASQDEGVKHTGKKTGENLEEQSKADRAWTKLQSGRAIFGDDEAAFLKVYKNDKAKMAKYHDVND